MDYTILGGAVNLASRMEQQAEPGGILITYETYAHVRDQIECLEGESLQVKGIAYPVSTYSVLGTKSLTNDASVLHAQAPHIEVTADLAKMQLAEREQAAQLLLSIARKLQLDAD